MKSRVAAQRVVILLQETISKIASRLKVSRAMFRDNGRVSCTKSGARPTSTYIDSHFSISWDDATLSFYPNTHAVPLYRLSEGLECCNEHLLVPDFSHLASEISCKSGRRRAPSLLNNYFEKISRADSELSCVTADSMLNIGLHLGCSRSGEKIMVAKTITSTRAKHGAVSGRATSTKLMTNII